MNKVYLCEKRNTDCLMKVEGDTSDIDIGKQFILILEIFLKVQNDKNISEFKTGSGPPIWGPCGASYRESENYPITSGHQPFVVTIKVYSICFDKFKRKLSVFVRWKPRAKLVLKAAHAWEQLLQ